MKNKAKAFLAVALVAAAGLTARADQNVYGVNAVVVPANSDAQFSVPFTQDVLQTLTVASKVGNAITVNQSVPANTYAANTYYVRVMTGNGAGLWSTITANTSANVLTIETAGVANLLAATDTIRVYKHQTLASVFKPEMKGLSYVNGTRVLFYSNDLSIIGQNKSPLPGVATWSDSQNRWIGSGISNNTILKPETRFILRNGAVNPLTVYTMGNAADYSVSMLIAANNDLNIGSGYPVPIKLNVLGANGTNSRRVLFFDNATTGQNKSSFPIATWSTSQKAWLGSGVTGNNLIGASEAITFRTPSVEPVTKITLIKPY